MEMITRYSRFLQGEKVSVHTVKAYTSDLKLFFEFVNKEYQDVTILDIDDWKYSIKDLASATANRKVIVIKAFFSWLEDRDLIVKNPTKGLKAPKIQEREVRFTPSDEQVNLLIEKSNTIRMKAMLATLASTGLRFDEMSNIKLDSITNGKKVIIDAVKVMGKGSKSRTVFLDKRATERINDYLKVRKQGGADTLFVSDQASMLDNSAVNRSLKTLAKKAGIAEFKDCESHMLRRSFITKLWAKGVSPAVICSLTGHASLDVEMKHYITISDEDKRLALQ